MVEKDPEGLYHPANEEDIVALINYAITEKFKLRVRGSDQSVSASIYTDDYNFKRRDYMKRPTSINIMLDQMREVTFYEHDPMLVTVQAGCNLGFDPYDPSRMSTEDNSLFRILKSKGLAIPNVPDAIHQTVAGFISTSSSGGSMTHSFLDAIVSIRIIDGNAKTIDFHRPDPDNENDPFYAVGVSMGLLGVIVSVTFRCVPTFNVIGEQAVTCDDQGAVSLFDPEAFPNLSRVLTEKEFCRLIWWPYPSAKRLVVWHARTMKPEDYSDETGTPDDFKPKPFQDAFYPSFLSKNISGKLREIIGLSTELVIGGIFSVIGKWPCHLKAFGNYITIFGKKLKTTDIQKVAELTWPIVFPRLLDIFMPLDKENPPQKFWDNWIDGLANDLNEYKNNLLPAFRTELWVPIALAEKMMNIINSYYQNQLVSNSNAENRNDAHICYVVEILAAKSNSFWMSPGYHQDSIRLNFYSLKQTDGSAVKFFQQFWDLFYINKIDFRLHWGYYLPLPSSPEGSGYLKKQYPKWNDFMLERTKMDPHNIFLNKYWKEQLNIA